jgi:large subunit ribosomal protein L7A
VDDFKPAGKRLIGTKQVLKAAAAGKLIKVYIACDAESFIAQKIRDVCGAAGVPLEEVKTMEELGKACGIEVGAACVGILAQED